MSRKTENVLGVIAGVLGLLMAVGVKTFLHPCVHEDGTAAACAEAGWWIFRLGIALGLGGFGMIRAKGNLRVAWAAALLILSVGMILAPGVLWPVCAMAEMRCNLVTRPAALVSGVLCAALSLAALSGALKKRKETT